MIKYLMKKYALTEHGARDFIKASCWATFADLAMMIPVSIIYFIICDLLGDGITKTGYMLNRPI